MKHFKTLAEIARLPKRAHERAIEARERIERLQFQHRNVIMKRDIRKKVEEWADVTALILTMAMILWLMILYSGL